MRPISAEATRGTSHLNSGTSKGSFTPLLQLKKFPDYSSPLKRKQKSPAHIQKNPVSAFYLERMDPLPACSVKYSRHSRHISRGGALHRKGERNSRVVPPFPESPRYLSPFRGKLFSLHCLDLQAEDQLTLRWHVGQTSGKASRERHRCLDPREGKRDLAATAREERAHACPHSRRGLTPLGRLQKYPKIHVSTGEESSGSGTEYTQDLWPRHRWKRNPESPPSNSHGDCPFLRPPEQVHEVPVVRREHLPQLEQIQVVLASRRDEAHFR